MVVTIQNPMRKIASLMLYWITSLLVIYLLWLLRHINRVKYACKQAYSASICMALNSYILTSFTYAEVTL